MRIDQTSEGLRQPIAAFCRGMVKAGEVIGGNSHQRRKRCRMALPIVIMQALHDDEKLAPRGMVALPTGHDGLIEIER